MSNPIQAINIDPSNKDYVTVVTKCPFCHHTHEIPGINRHDLYRWQDGDAHIMIAMPYLNSQQRELLITGADYDCWRLYLKPLEA